MNPFRRIFVAVDFSSFSDEALRQAAEGAKATQGKLAVCHIVPDEMRSNLLFPQKSEAEVEAVPIEAERAAEAVLNRVGEVLDTTSDVEIIADHGSPYAEILRRAESWNADLIAVGSHGMTGSAGILLGSVSHRVIRYAHCAVLIARRPKARGRIVAGTDFSDPALPAIETAVYEARRVNAQLTVVHSIDPYWTTTSIGALDGVPIALTAELYETMQRQARERLTDIFKTLAIEGEIAVTSGPPAQALISAAVDKNAELLVVGTVGRTGLARLVLGSVAEAVASHAPCSVLVVRIHRT